MHAKIGQDWEKNGKVTYLKNHVICARLNFLLKHGMAGQKAKAFLQYLS